MLVSKQANKHVNKLKSKKVSKKKVCNFSKAFEAI